MANLTALRGACVAPFFQESHFPSTGGFVLGRYCAPMPGSADEVSCCLPCPATDWVYPDNFLSLTRMAGWVNVFGIILTIFILLSFIFLPKERTKRQYLNVCLILGIILMELGFIIPLGARPTQCYNEITPNDMTSSMTCAWSGALIVAGGVSITMWILIRTLSMHLQICWDITPGVRFFYSVQFLGWTVSAGIVTAAMVVSGVSFRFGDACHINHRNSLQSLWGPLMGIAGVSFILQIATFIYCMNIYLRNLRYDSKPSSGHYNPESPYPKSNPADSPNPGQRNPKARAVYKRVTKVLSLQWRGLLICFIMLVDVAFFSVVFVYFDTKTQAALSNFPELLPWLVCLINSVQPGHGGKNACLEVASHLVVSEPVVIATLLLLSIIGVQALLLVGRAGMLVGWLDLARNNLSRLRQRRAPKTTFDTTTTTTASYASPMTITRTRSRSDSTDTESLAATKQQHHQYPLTTTHPTRPYELLRVTTPATPASNTPLSPDDSLALSPLSPQTDADADADQDTSSLLNPPATTYAGPLSRSDWFSKEIGARLDGRHHHDAATAGAAAAPPRSPLAEYNHSHGRRYCSPRMSFSSPRPPGSAGRGAVTPVLGGAGNQGSPPPPPAPVAVLGEWEWERERERGLERAGSGRVQGALGTGMGTGMGMGMGMGTGPGEAVLLEEEGGGVGLGVGKEGWV